MRLVLTLVVEEQLVVALWRGVLAIEFAETDDVFVRDDVVAVFVLLHDWLLGLAKVARSESFWKVL